MTFADSVQARLAPNEILAAQMQARLTEVTAENQRLRREIDEWKRAARAHSSEIELPPNHRLVRTLGELKAQVKRLKIRIQELEPKANAHDEITRALSTISTHVERSQ